MMREEEQDNIWTCCASLISSLCAGFTVICMIILYTIPMLVLMIIVSKITIADLPINFVLSFFQGSIIVFPVRSSVQILNSNALEYCHPTLYNCAFWTLIIYYAIFAFILSGCFICFYRNIRHWILNLNIILKHRFTITLIDRIFLKTDAPTVLKPTFYYMIVKERCRKCTSTMPWQPTWSMFFFHRRRK